jgi:hypothetical protein
MPFSGTRVIASTNERISPGRLINEGVPDPQKPEERRHFDQSSRADLYPFNLAALHLVVDHRATQARNLGGVIHRASQPSPNGMRSSSPGGTLPMVEK